MQQGMRRRALAAAFPHTVPILAGFLFLGMAYGIYMNVSGFPFWYPMLMGAYHLRWLAGVCGGEHAAGALCTGTDLSDGPDASGPPPVLRHCHAGKIPGCGPKTLVSDLRHVRRELFHQLQRRDSGGRGPGLVLFLGHPAQPRLLGNRRHAGRPCRVAALL